MRNALSQRLSHVLAVERAALLDGNLAEVFQQTSEKDALLEQLDKSHLPAEALTGLLAELAENQALLSAALEGVRNAQQRLADLAKVRDGLTVYNKNGQAGEIKNARPALERKA